MMRRTVILLAGIFMFATVNYAGMYAQSSREEFGKCGYYADALHGKKTASGEKYDKTLLTCSHKTLPFGTSLKITRLDNGKSVVVRVNDRGPFIDGYIVDVSRSAAVQLGLIRDGVAKVKVEIVNATSTTNAATTVVKPATYATGNSAVEPADPAPQATTSRPASVAAAKAQLVKGKSSDQPATSVAPATYNKPTTTQPVPAAAQSAGSKAIVSELYQIELKTVRGSGYGLQLAVLSSTESLFQTVSTLQATWPGKVMLNHEGTAGNEMYKIILGPYAPRKEAEAQERKAASKGYKKAFVVAFE